MLSVQLNLVENETSTAGKSEKVSQVASVMAGEVSYGKGRTDEQAADAMYAAFAWLFGSGCF